MASLDNISSTVTRKEIVCIFYKRITILVNNCENVSKQKAKGAIFLSNAYTADQLQTNSLSDIYFKGKKSCFLICCHTKCVIMIVRNLEVVTLMLT